MNIDFLFILDEETKFLALNSDKKKCRDITSPSQFNELISNGFQVKNVIIFVELNWGNPISQFYGYKIAKELIENSSNRLSNFNLLFISTLRRETIYKILKDKNRIFTQKFKHKFLSGDFDLNKVVIPDISSKKFDYLKNYCLLRSGILDRLEHDVKNLLNNIDLAKLQKAIDEIQVNKDILTPEIISFTKKLAAVTDFEKRERLLNDIHHSLLVLQNQINNPEECSEKKSHVKVMLVEDDEVTLSKLKEQLGQYFHNITPFQKGSNAFSELEQNARQYDVVITDMELLDENFDDEKQGIDILELCEIKYPYIVTRVITALPKNALKRLIGKGIGEIVFKSRTGDMVIPPFENLVEFVKQIEKDVQKKRQLRKMQGPEISWWGKYLTKQLYITKIEEPEKYNAIRQTAINQANRFIKGELDALRNDEKISVKFKQVKETGSNPESGWDIIELLLTHRLIALWFSAKHLWKEFYFFGDSYEAYVKLNGFQQGLESKSIKAYFNTSLGLSVKGASEKRKLLKRCKILPKNLFPEEIEWLSSIKPNTLESIPLRDINDDFHEYFVDFMTKYTMYDKVYNDVEEEKIKALKIAADEWENITFGAAMKLLDNFIEKFPHEQTDRHKYDKLKRIFTHDLDEFYELLPTEVKARIDIIRKEIFGCVN